MCWVEPPARGGAPLRSTLRSRRQTLQCSTARPTKGSIALRRFLEAWSPARFDATPFTPEMLDANIVFRLDGELGYIHSAMPPGA